MKRLLVIAAFLVMCINSWGQIFKIGSKALKAESREWLTEPPTAKRQTILVEFFHSSNSTCVERIDTLRQIASQHADSLTVIVVVRGDDSKGQQILVDKRQGYFVAQTTPRSLRALGVRYVPYAYVACPNRRVAWCGNPVFLKHETLKTIISDGNYNDRPLRKTTSRRTRK